MLPEHCVPTGLGEKQYDMYGFLLKQLVVMAMDNSCDYEGGSLQVSTDEFVQKRLEIEGTAEGIEGTAEGARQNLSFSEADSDMIDIVNRNVFQEDVPAVAGVTSRLHETGIQSVAADVAASVAAQTNVSADSVASQTNASVQQKRAKKGSGTRGGKTRTTGKTSGGRQERRGRQGDPRMNRAVQVKIEDPSLSTIAAL